MNAVMKHEDVELLDAMPSQALAPTDNPYMAMASRALELGKVEQLDKLLDLQFKWEAEQARKAFHTAMAAFKESPLVITKDKENKQYNSMYTTLGNLVNTASEAMAPFGLSADWNIEQNEKLIKVTCVLSHAAGFSKSVTLEAAPDTSGQKNSIQQIKSTVTYLRGATFEAVTGLASQERAGINRDDDGNGAGRRSQAAQRQAQAEPTAAEKLAAQKARHDEAHARNSESIAYIKERLSADDAEAAKSEWYALSEADQRALWLATSKGGCLSTAEREIIKYGKTTQENAQ